MIFMIGMKIWSWTGQGHFLRVLNEFTDTAVVREKLLFEVPQTQHFSIKNATKCSLYPLKIIINYSTKNHHISPAELLICFSSKSVQCLFIG